jgi:hypothetical protein
MIMSSQAIGGTTGVAAPESEYTFVVYEKGTGAIHHVHQVINMPGAELRSQREMEKTALAYVPDDVRQRTPADGLAVLSVSPGQLERKKYRVDHQKKALVEEKR